MNHTIGSNDNKLSAQLMLAPMVDLTGYAFRQLIRAFGGCDLFYSEMINAQKVIHESNNHPLLKGIDNESDLILQLVGNDPKVIAQAIKRLDHVNVYGFDLNLGCSRSTIVNKGWGAGLCRDISNLHKVIKAMRESTSKHLSVKIRDVWHDDHSTEIFMQMLEAEGVDMIVVHPRTPEKIFARPAKWDFIKKVKSLVNIPVIGNGDVTTPQDVLSMLANTGCDSVMIGRAAAADPTIFFNSKLLIEKGMVPEKLKASVVFQKMIDCFGEEVHLPKRVKELRLFCKYFAEGLPVPHWFWGPIQSSRDPNVIIKKSLAFLERNDL